MAESSVSNYIFLLIPLAIFIGRIVARARNKHNPPPKKPPQPYIPIHFEDDNYNDESDYLEDEIVSYGKGKSLPNAKKSKTSRPVKTGIGDEGDLFPSSLPKAVSVSSVKSAAPVRENEFSLNLERFSKKLSPMQQAVAMAEILGPPKGMN